MYDDAMFDFMGQHLPTLKPGSSDRYRISAKALTPHFLGKFLDAINREVLSGFEMRRRRDGVTGSTIRRDLACLSSMYSHEIEAGRIDINPVLPFMKMRRKRGLRESPPRTRYLTHAEEAKLLSNATPYLRPIITVAIDTGMRLEEQLSLEWWQVDLRRGEITLDKTKTDLPRKVPLLPRSAQILAQFPQHIKSPFVFHKKGGPRDGERYEKLNRGLAGAVRRSGIPHIQWHDLRRTCGCRLLQDHKLSMEEVSKWLGHTSTKTTERSYAFLEVRHLHDAINRAKEAQDG